MVNVTNYTDGITLVQFKIVQEHNLKERLVDVKTSSVDLELNYLFFNILNIK